MKKKSTMKVSKGKTGRTKILTSEGAPYPTKVGFIRRLYGNVVAADKIVKSLGGRRDRRVERGSDGFKRAIEGCFAIRLNC